MIPNFNRARKTGADFTKEDHRRRLKLACKQIAGASTKEEKEEYELLTIKMENFFLKKWPLEDDEALDFQEYVADALVGLFIGNILKGESDEY